MTIPISLSFKTYIHIRLIPVAILRQPEKPFYDIENVEWQEEQFPLLRCMDTLVIDHISVNPRRIPCPICPKQIDTYPFGYEFGFYNHGAESIIFQSYFPMCILSPRKWGFFPNHMSSIILSRAKNSRNAKRNLVRFPAFTGAATATAFIPASFAR